MAGSVALMNLLDVALVAFVTHGAHVFDSAGGVVGWCRVNGIARATFYRHLARVRQDGSWAPLSRRPRRSPGGTAPPVVAAILALRESLGVDNGAVTIHYHLGRDPDLAGMRIPSPATIHKILRRAGLVTAQPNKRPRSSWRRFSYARPRDCYQIDATIITLAGGAKVVVFEVLDDATRTLVATRAALSENATDAVAAISTAFTDFGVPAIVLSDNGIAFTARFTRHGGTSRFTRAVTAAGARLIHSSPYHPQTCGKVERHHRTFKNWLATHPAPATLEQLQQLCTTYQHWYNTVRPHSVHHTPPWTAWQNAAADLGGPQHLPLQQDAQVCTRKVTPVGTIQCANTTISVGMPRSGQRLTIVRDGQHLTAYDPDGTPFVHLVINPTKKHQGQLTPAA